MDVFLTIIGVLFYFDNKDKFIEEQGKRRESGKVNVNSFTRRVCRVVSFNSHSSRVIKKTEGGGFFKHDPTKLFAVQLEAMQTPMVRAYLRVLGP